MKCSHCGEEIRGDIVFCIKCGYPVPAENNNLNQHKESHTLESDSAASSPNGAANMPNGAVNQQPYQPQYQQQNGMYRGRNEYLNNDNYNRKVISPQKNKSKLPIVIVITIIIIAIVVGVCFAIGVFDSQNTTSNDDKSSKKSEDVSKIFAMYASEEPSYDYEEYSEKPSYDYEEYSSAYEEEPDLSEEAPYISEEDFSEGEFNVDDRFKSLASYKALEKYDVSDGFNVCIGYEISGTSYYTISAFKDGRRCVITYYSDGTQETVITFLYIDGYGYALDEENYTYTKEKMDEYWDIRHPVEYFFYDTEYLQTTEEEYMGENYTVDSIKQSDVEMNIYVDEYGNLEYCEVLGVFMDVFISEGVDGFIFDIPEGYTEVF